jgi:hypothetical protein
MPAAARVVQCQLREYLKSRPRRGFAHVGVELGVPAESAGHRRPNASVADPSFQRNCCDASCLDINCDGDEKPCRRARVSAAINKDRARQHSPRLIVIQAGPQMFLQQFVFSSSVINRLIRHRINRNQVQFYKSMLYIRCVDPFCLGALVELQAVLDQKKSLFRRRFLPKRDQIHHACL